MRGVSLRIFTALAFWPVSACAGGAAPAPSETRDPRTAPAEEPRGGEAPAVYRFPEEAGGNGVMGAVQAAAEAPRKPQLGLDEAFRILREAAAKENRREEDVLRLALMQAACGSAEEAHKTLSIIRPGSHRMRPYLELFLRRELGDHEEADRLLGRLAAEGRSAAGFSIGRAELCSRVRRYRDYVPADGPRVRPGGTALVYVEPRNFALSREGERFILHLRYDWRLFDERSVERPVPAWEKAPQSDREDRLALIGPVAEFHQSFALPLPADLPPGRYRIKVTVTDVATGASDTAYVPIEVAAQERER